MEGLRDRNEGLRDRNEGLRDRDEGLRCGPEASVSGRKTVSAGKETFPKCALPFVRAAEAVFVEPEGVLAETEAPGARRKPLQGRLGKPSPAPGAESDRLLALTIPNHEVRLAFETLVRENQRVRVKRR
jgi:hypothetical protein